MASAKKKTRHWTREETLSLIHVWGEPRNQRLFENMVHNHTVWENIYVDLVQRCPSIQEFGEWPKCKERLDYLRRKYRDSLKNNRKTGSNPVKCPYFDELDAVLVGSTESPEDYNTSRENDAEDEASSHDSASKEPTPPPPPPLAEPKLQAHRRRKGRKTQIMEAMDKSLDRLLQSENTHNFDRERFEWEKELERNRMELEQKRLDFEMKKMEADEKRAEENRALMLQLFQCFRPQSQIAPFSAPHYYPYTPPPHRSSAESMDYPSTAPGPPAPAAYQVHYYNDPPS